MGDFLRRAIVVVPGPVHSPKDLIPSLSIASLIVGTVGTIRPARFVHGRCSHCNQLGVLSDCGFYAGVNGAVVGRCTCARVLSVDCAFTLFWFCECALPGAEGVSPGQVPRASVAGIYPWWEIPWLAAGAVSSSICLWCRWKTSRCASAWR